MRVGCVVLALHQLAYVDRRDLLCERTSIAAGHRTLLAAQAVVVLPLAVDAVARRHVLGGLDHGLVHPWHMLLQPRIALAVRVGVRVDCETHGVESTGNYRGNAVEQNAVRAHRNGLEPRAAKTVYRHARGVFRQPSAQGDDAADVHARAAFGAGRAHDHILDLVGCQPGALNRMAYGVRAEHCAVRFVEGTPIGPADGRARRGNDDGIDGAHASAGPDWRIAPLDSNASMSASGTPEAFSTCTVDSPICCGAER